MSAGGSVCDPAIGDATVTAAKTRASVESIRFMVHRAALFAYPKPDPSNGCGEGYYNILRGHSRGRRSSGCNRKSSRLGLPLTNALKGFPGFLIFEHNHAPNHFGRSAILPEPPCAVAGFQPAGTGRGARSRQPASGTREVSGDHRKQSG